MCDGADQLEDDVRPAQLADERERLVGPERRRAELGDRRPKLLGAHVRHNPRAHRRADLDGRRPHPAARPVHEEHVAGREAGLHDDRVERGQERLRHGRGGLRIERIGDPHQLALDRQHALAHPAAADEAEHPVSDGERRDPLPYRDHRPGHLQASDVGRPPRGRHMASLALEHVGRVHAGERRRDHDLEPARNGVRPLLDGDDLAAARPVVDDAPHAGG